MSFKNLILAGAVMFSGFAANAGTSKELDYNEQKVVALALVKYIPSLLSGGAGTLTECNLTNAADPGTKVLLIATCTFTAPGGKTATASFDQIELDRNQKVIAAQFESLIRN